MVTKGIITSIDFNGNTCQVRIPLFETAGNDPIISTAVVSNTPGSYNGYKVDDVVLVAFEDGKMETPVVIGKLYLGAEKEKADPRGSLNTESLVAAKTAAVPADTKLTTNTDKNLPNTMNPYANLSSIANNLNKLNTDVNYLDVFTNNQFSSVITDVNKQGEELRSEIKQTSSNIEAKVDKEHDSTTTGLGWNLTTDSWKINAQDTVNGVVKDINIVTIDRNGMSIAGDLKLNGYPKNIIVRYARNGSDKDYPYLYNFKQVDFPGTEIDKTWYHDKYIKIIEADKEKYILISNKNIDDYNIIPGETVAYVYNLEETNPKWKTETPARVDGQYIWQWTHTESFLFDKNTNSWDEQDDDKVVCITGANGEKGDQGDAGYNTATVMLYKRSTNSVSDKPIDTDLYYKFSDQKLYTDNTLKEEYRSPTGWSYTISGAGDSSKGDLYCIAAVAHSNTESDKILLNEWVGPTLYVKNGEPTITLSIENDFDSVPCDSDGNPSYSELDWKTKTKHTIKVLEGQNPQAFNVIKFSSDNQIPSTGYVVVYKPDSSITYVVDTTDPTLFTAHITGLTTDSANVLYTLYKNGIPIDEARFVATKLKAGAPGDSAVDYDILFSSGTIKVSKTGDKTPRTINVNFKETVGQNKPVDFSGTYKVFIDNGTKPISQGTANSIVLATNGAADQQIDVSKAKSGVIVELYTTDGNTKLECETIDVVADGTDGTSAAQLILYKRSTKIPSGPAADGKWTYNATDGSLKCSNKPTWSTSIPSGAAPCYESHAAVLVTGLDTITIKDEKWSAPAKFVENGADGQPGVYIKEVKQWYILWLASASTNPTKPTNNTVPTEPATSSTVESWMSTPPEAVNDHVVWTCYGSIFSDDTPEDRHIEYSDPVKDNAYALAQGKTTNYYSPTEPVNKINIGDCWFDTGYVKIDPNPENKAGYLGKFIISADGNISVNQDEHDADRYIPAESKSSSTKLIKITPANIDTLINNKTIVVGTTKAFETGNLKQCSGFDKGTKKAIWKDIAGELVTNKLTANYINALDITSKKIQVLASNNDTLFSADGINGNGEVNIGGFTVNSNRLYAGTPGTSNSIELASAQKLIAYKSNNQGVASSYAVSKITVNKATDLTVYIRSYADPGRDYTMISNPNVSSYPTSSSSSDVKADTSLDQNSSSELTGYKKVEYYDLKQNDYIYIVYRKDNWTTDSGTDTGYLLIPETTDISITAVGNTYYFVRDASLDIKEAGASLKVGSNFSVDAEGKIYTTAGKIGALELTPTTLGVGKRFSGDNSFLYLNTENNYAPTGWNDRAEDAVSTLEASSARFNVQILGIDIDSSSLERGSTVIYMDGRQNASRQNASSGLVSVYQTRSDYQVHSRIPITEFERLPISIGGYNSPYIIPGPKKWNNKKYAPVRIILSGEKLDPETDKWYNMSDLCKNHHIIIIDGVATSAIAKASNTSLSGYKQIAAAYYENPDLSKFKRGELTSTSQIPYSSLWIGNDGDGGSVSKISFIITGWAVSDLV